MTPLEYNNQIRSRTKSTITFTVECDSSASNSAGALAKILEKLGTALEVRELKDWYSWEPFGVLSFTVDGIKIHSLSVPKLDIPEEVEAES